MERGGSEGKKREGGRRKGSRLAGGVRCFDVGGAVEVRGGGGRVVIVTVTGMDK